MRGQAPGPGPLRRLLRLIGVVQRPAHPFGQGVGSGGDHRYARRLHDHRPAQGHRLQLGHARHSEGVLAHDHLRAGHEVQERRTGHERVQPRARRLRPGGQDAPAHAVDLDAVGHEGRHGVDERLAALRVIPARGEDHAAGHGPGPLASHRLQRQGVGQPLGVRAQRGHRLGQVLGGVQHRGRVLQAEERQLPGHRAVQIHAHVRAVHVQYIGRSRPPAVVAVGSVVDVHDVGPRARAQPAHGVHCPPGRSRHQGAAHGRQGVEHPAVTRGARLGHEG